jgi:hypothetical protein
MELLRDKFEYDFSKEYLFIHKQMWSFNWKGQLTFLRYRVVRNPKLIDENIYIPDAIVTYKGNGKYKVYSVYWGRPIGMCLNAGLYSLRDGEYIADALLCEPRPKDKHDDMDWKPYCKNAIMAFRWVEKEKRYHVAYEMRNRIYDFQFIRNLLGVTYMYCEISDYDTKGNHINYARVALGLDMPRIFVEPQNQDHTHDIQMFDANNNLCSYNYSGIVRGPWKPDSVHIFIPAFNVKTLKEWQTRCASMLKIKNDIKMVYDQKYRHIDKEVPWGYDCDYPFPRIIFANEINTASFDKYYVFTGCYEQASLPIHIDNGQVMVLRSNRLSLSTQSTSTFLKTLNDTMDRTISSKITQPIFTNCSYNDAKCTENSTFVMVRNDHHLYKNEIDLSFEWYLRKDTNLLLFRNVQIIELRNELETIPYYPNLTLFKHAPKINAKNIFSHHGSINQGLVNLMRSCRNILDQWQTPLSLDLVLTIMEYLGFTNAKVMSYDILACHQVFTTFNEVDPFRGPLFLMNLISDVLLDNENTSKYVDCLVVSRNRCVQIGANKTIPKYMYDTWIEISALHDNSILCDTSQEIRIKRARLFSKDDFITKWNLMSLKHRKLYLKSWNGVIDWNDFVNITENEIDPNEPKVGTGRVMYELDDPGSLETCVLDERNGYC